MNRDRRDSGFTLIETMFVLGIIAVLATMAVTVICFRFVVPVGVEIAHTRL